MTTCTSPTSLPQAWQQQALEYIESDQFSQASHLYEQAIEIEPFEFSYYCYLGLIFLLQGQEEEAQTTWLFALSEIEVDQVSSLTAQLIEILRTEAERRTAKHELSIAWAIRQHLRELCPTDIDNLLWIVSLSIKLELAIDSILEEIDIIQHLREPSTQVPLGFLLTILEMLLKGAPAFPELIQFTDAAINHLQDTIGLVDAILAGILRFGFGQRNYQFAIELANCALRINPDHLQILGFVAALHYNSSNFVQGIEIAKHRYQLAQNLPEQIYSNSLILRGLLETGGRWQEVVQIGHYHTHLLKSLIGQQPENFEPVHLSRLLNSGYYLVYLQDQPQQWRPLENQVLELVQTHIQRQAAALEKQYIHQKRSRTNNPLKIGYLSHCMATHSVGWLARWLFQHHDRTQTEIYGYFIGYREVYDPLQAWYVQTVDHVRKFVAGGSETHIEIADQIYQDEIDILIDLDSITLDITCQVLALKPAPIQVTWLGWDASGLPAIDYFIADPYVLPSDAQSYYSEKIWRLPQTYIAVDGFEVDPPTLRRKDLEIPEDAVIYLSAQRGYKRHQDHTRTQLKIIKQVPNSYFLIKGIADVSSVQDFFYKLAEEEGVSCNRLRFLESDPSSQIHRANLQIADIVLDTFPYNGATTTLETLWMGIPLVTRVGEQFAARNSYTMMQNAGISEGIAWTDEEYIEWGVKLGVSKDLRDQIHCKLHRLRQTSPLWNGKQFAREMESAYQAMWTTYLES